MRKRLSPKKIGKELEKEIGNIAKTQKLKILKNVYIGYKAGGHQYYAELDLILICESGIIAVESKNYSCDIVGDTSNSHFKALYSSGKSFDMYNPILQNEGHIKHLEGYLKADILSDVESLIVFSDKANLKLSNINGTKSNILLIGELEEYLEKYQNKNKIYSKKQVDSIYKKLKLRVKVSPLVKKRHRKQVKFAKKY